MTDQATRVVPAGWYEDPSDAGQVRWWNGINWTDHTQPKPDLDGDAAAEAEAQAATAAIRVRNRVRATSTVESWVVAFSPALLAAALLVGGWAWLYLSPTLLWVGLAVVAVYAVVTVFAVLDRRKLTSWEHTPPPFAMALLTAPVYLLVRALRLPRSWSQLVAWGLLMLALVGGPLAAWFGGALHGVQTAVRIQTEIRDTIVVDGGEVANVACPPIADATTVGSTYACDVTLRDGTHTSLVVSIDSDAGDYSYTFSLR